MNKEIQYIKDKNGRYWIKQGNDYTKCEQIEFIKEEDYGRTITTKD